MRTNLPTGEYGVVNAAFLVESRALERFDQEVDAAGADLAGLIRIRYVGPLVPYSFVDLGLD